MVDVVESYGYSEALRSRLVGGKPFPDRANIGIFGWRGEDLDLDWLEHAVRTLLDEEGTHYNLTQAVTSMLFAGRDCDVAPEDDYVVLPSVKEGRRPTVVLHHYVAESKRSYFQHGWGTCSPRSPSCHDPIRTHREGRSEGQGGDRSGSAVGGGERHAPRPHGLPPIRDRVHNPDGVDDALLLPRKPSERPDVL